MSNTGNKKYPPLSERDELCDVLWDLYFRLHCHMGDPAEAGNSMLEAYKYFVDTAGRECSNSLKSQKRFMREDYRDVRGLFLKALETFRKIEGPAFGR